MHKNRPEVELDNITFNVHCICHRYFKAEEFKPECPYCDRKYIVKIEVNPPKIKLEIEPFPEV